VSAEKFAENKRVEVTQAQAMPGGFRTGDCAVCLAMKLKPRLARYFLE